MNDGLTIVWVWAMPYNPLGDVLCLRMFENATSKKVFLKKKLIGYEMNVIPKLKIIIAIIVIWFACGVSSLAGPYEDAEDAYFSENYAQAVKLFTPLADNGHAASEYCMGQLYKYGRAFQNQMKKPYIGIRNLPGKATVRPKLDGLKMSAAAPSISVNMAVMDMLLENIDAVIHEKV